MTGDGVPNFAEVDTSKCWVCGKPYPGTAQAPAPAPMPANKPDLAHVLLTVVSVGLFVGLKYYGVDIQGVSDLLEIVGGASLWGHAKQLSATVRSQEQ